MLNWFDFLGLAVTVGVAVILLRPNIRDSEMWRATVTPLASIVGSGFLIVAPLLAATVGSASTLAISGIVALSLWLGSALRYTIRQVPPTTALSQLKSLERVSEIVLAVAYVISIAFYIRLLAAFVLTGLDLHSAFSADLLSTAILLFIGLYGMRYGLRGLERLEEYSVTIKLSIIAGLLLWLLHHDLANHFDINGLSVQAISADPFNQLRILCGMILVIQGFETSKYLGAEYSAPIRARTLLRAQLIAGTIYILFVALVTPLMPQINLDQIDETAIIEMSRLVTPLLPPLLIIAAVMSQFSASVADTLGAGGVVERRSNQKIQSRFAYPLLTISAVALIWATNIYEIVAFASRAFALFYLIQSIQAARVAALLETGMRRQVLVASYSLLAVLMLFIVIFAKAVEGV